MSQLNVLPLDISQPTDFKGDKSIGGGALFGSTTDNGCFDKKPESSFAQVIERHLEEKNSRSDAANKNTEQKQASLTTARENSSTKNDIKNEELSSQSLQTTENVEQSQQSKSEIDVKEQSKQNASIAEKEQSIDQINQLDNEKVTSSEEHSSAFMKMLYAAGEMLLGKKVDAGEMQNAINAEFNSDEDALTENSKINNQLLNNQKNAHFEISEEMAAQFKDKLMPNDQSTQPVNPILPIVSELEGAEGEQLTTLLAKATNAAKVAAISVDVLSETKQQDQATQVLQKELKNIQQLLQSTQSTMSSTEQDDVGLLKALNSDAVQLTKKVENLLTEEQTKKLLAALTASKQSKTKDQEADIGTKLNVGLSEKLSNDSPMKDANFNNKNNIQSLFKVTNDIDGNVIKNTVALSTDKSINPAAKVLEQSIGQQFSHQNNEQALEANSDTDNMHLDNDGFEEYISSKLLSENANSKVSNQLSHSANSVNITPGVIQANVESQFAATHARAEANAADLAIDNLAMKQSTDISQLQKSQQMQLNEVVNVFRKDFADSLKDKVMIMMSNRLQQIDIQLDPPELGNMHVRVNLQNEQAAVSFVVQNQQAKEAVEQQLSRLREMLAERGIDVGDANVRQENSNKNQQMADEQGRGNNPSSTPGEDGDFIQHEMSVQQLVNASSNGVDFYA